MQSLTRFTIEHARLTWLLITAVTLGGVSVFLSQPRQEDPEITLRTAQVVTQLPGMSPERIEQLLTRPVEESIKTISEIEEITSLSMTGVSIVVPEAHARYSEMEPIWSDLRNKMADLARQLPEGSQGPQVNDDYGRVAVITLALTGEDFTMAELYSAARTSRDVLSALPLVARVDLYGVQEERIWIEFDPAFMAQFGLEPNQVIAAIQDQNVVLPGGTVEADGRDIVIQPSGDFGSIDELRRVAIQTESNQVVYLEDLAHVRRGYVEPASAPAFYNGEQAIVLGISMNSGSNVVELGEQVQAELAGVRGGLPLGMDLAIAIFAPELVQASVESATVNLAQTIAVVLLIVMLVLGLRSGLIVGAMVPLTMMATLIGMSLWGIELHRVSIAAIIVALGLLVDNGVVVAEDIQKRMDEGMDRMAAAVGTAGSLAVPLLTSSLTTVAAFVPLMLIEGGSGEFLRSLGQVLAVALLSSWFIAITVIPAFCYWFLPESSKGADQGIDSAPTSEGAMYRGYRRLLRGLLRVRLPFVIVMLLLLLGSTQLFQFIKKRSLGPSERNQFTLYVDLPAGTSISETTEVTSRITSFLLNEEENPEVTSALAYVGGGGPRFFLALAPNDPQPNKAFLVVNTKEADQIHAVMERAEQFFVEEVPEGGGRSDILFLGGAPLGTVELLVRGPELGEIKRIANRVAGVFHDVPGIRGVRDNWENSVLKLEVEIDQERARRAGVTSTDVANGLATYFDGSGVTTYREGDLTIPVVIRARPEDRGSLDRVRTVGIRSAQQGHSVPLLQVANFLGDVEPSRIRRIDQKRALKVSGKHPDLTAAELYARLKSGLADIELRPGYTLDVEGELAESEESNKELFKFAPHAMFGILLLLVLQFNSFRRPAVILMTIPLVLIGANVGLLVFRGYFDFTAMLGLFSLAGIIINNGIVLIDRIDQGRAEGMTVNEAVIDAGLARVRPIIMTTATTILGLIPMALFGGEFWFGMAIVIMCGLGVGTILTLGFVPVAYSLLFAFRRTASSSVA